MDRVRYLLTRYRPGMSIRQIEQAAGLSENLLGYYLKPGSHVVRIPTVATLEEIARALKCTPEQVFLAFALDLEYPVPSSVRDRFDKRARARAAS